MYETVTFALSYTLMKIAYDMFQLVRICDTWYKYCNLVTTNFLYLRARDPRCRLIIVYMYPYCSNFDTRLIAYTHSFFAAETFSIKK